MALYQPLRDAFNDLNTMIVDSQQWDERHAAREADNEYRHAVQMANTKQQNFQNDMAVKAYDLRERGEDRAAAAAEQRILENKRNFDLSSKIHQFNKDKFKETQEVNDMNMKKTQLEIDEIRKPTIPVPLDFNGIISPRLAKNAAFMGELNEWTGSQNVIVGEDLIGMSADADGEYSERRMSPNEQAKYAPMLQGLVAKYDNPNDNAKEDMVALSEYHTELSKVKSVNGGYNHAEVAQAKHQMKVVEAEIESQKQNFKPETVRESYGRRAKEMYGAAMWLRQKGLMDDADGFETGALKFLDQAMAADKTSKGQRVPSWELDLKDNASVSGPDWAWSPVSEMFTRQVKQEDGSYVTESVGDLKEAGYTQDEPSPLSNAERGIGTGGAKGLMTEQQMTNVKSYYEAEGIVAGINADAARPKMAGLRTYIKMMHKKMGGTADTRQEAKVMTIMKTEEFENAYWDEVEAWEVLSNKDKTKVWAASGHRVVKGKTKKQQMKDYYYNGNFNPAMRELLGDKDMMVYRPNETTRKQTRGTTR